MGAVSRKIASGGEDARHHRLASYTPTTNAHRPRPAIYRSSKTPDRTRDRAQSLTFVTDRGRRTADLTVRIPLAITDHAALITQLYAQTSTGLADECALSSELCWRSRVPEMTASMRS